MKYNVRENDQIIGAIGNGTYFYKKVTPGTHTFTAATESTVSRTLDIEAGKTYYIKCGIDLGFMAGRPSMEISNAAEGKSVIPSLTYATK